MAPIRCGGVPKSYSKQLLLVGDAAGHVDPLTGKEHWSYLINFLPCWRLLVDWSDR